MLGPISVSCAFFPLIARNVCSICQVMYATHSLEISGMVILWTTLHRVIMLYLQCPILRFLVLVAAVAQPEYFVDRQKREEGRKLNFKIGESINHSIFFWNSS